MTSSSMKCARCCQVIENEENGCNALGENFHNSCFHCNRCGSQLFGKRFVHSSEYLKIFKFKSLILDNRVYCESCYNSPEVSQMLPNCSQCYKEINDTVCMAMGRRFHVDCFRCAACRTALADQEFRLGPGPELEVGFCDFLLE